MRRPTDLLRLPNDLEGGNTTLQKLMLRQLEAVLHKEVEWQNHLLFLSSVHGADMREVRDLAAGMRELIANLRKETADAKSELHAEVARSAVNAQKVRSFTKDLREANHEVESMLGETGSNFPPLEELNTQAPNGPVTEAPSGRVADINGVTKN